MFQGAHKRQFECPELNVTASLKLMVPSHQIKQSKLETHKIHLHPT